jgi:anti-sigma-K factor RskA
MEQKRCDDLLDYYNGILEGEEKEAFESHLLECSGCQQEWKEWQELTADLPYLSEEVEPPLGMKERILANVTSKETTDNQRHSEAVPIHMNKKTPRSWLTGLLAAGLLLSLCTNAYLFMENENKQVNQEQMSKTFKTVELASEGTESSGIASMVQEDGTTKLVIHTSNMSPVKGTEAYQVWLIEGDKKFRAGTFIPDENGNGAVVFNLTFPEEHTWNAVAISHEPTAKSKQPRGTIVMASNL